MERRTFFRLTATAAFGAIAPSFTGCLPDGAAPSDVRVNALSSGYVAFDGDGAMYELVPFEGMVYAVTPDGRREPAVASDSALNTPVAVCSNPGGPRYVLVKGSSELVRLGSDGRVERVVAGPGSAPGQLAMPSDAIAGPDGAIYVCDTLNHRIQVFDADGAFLRSFGEGGTGSGELNAPRGIAVAVDGTIYVANTGNRRVDVFDASGGHRGSFARPTPAFVPAALALTQDDALAVLDLGARRLYLYSRGGSVLDVRPTTDENGRDLQPLTIAKDPASGVLHVGAIGVG